MFIAEVNSSRTNLSPFTKGYRGLASRMQLVSNLLKGFPHGDPVCPTVPKIPASDIPMALDIVSDSTIISSASDPSSASATKGFPSFYWQIECTRAREPFNEGNDTHMINFR